MMLFGINIPASDANASLMPTQSRVKSTYADYIKIKQVIIKRLGTCFGPMLNWAPQGGIVCVRCSADTKLHGQFTMAKPVTTFTYTTCKNHLLCNKHKTRCPASEKEAIERLTNNTVLDKSALISDFESMCNLFQLLHKWCHNGYSFNNLSGIVSFIAQCGGTILANKYQNYPSHRDMICAMGDTQKMADFQLVREMTSTFGVGIVLDGHKIKTKGVNLYRERGYGVRDLYPRQTMLTVLDLQKKLGAGGHRSNQMHDLLSVETGRDIYETLDYLVRTEMGTSWDNVNAVSGDGKSAHFGKHRGLLCQARSAGSNSSIGVSVTHFDALSELV